MDLVKGEHKSEGGKSHCRLGSGFEISDLRIQGAFEGRPRSAAFDIGCEALLARDDIGVLGMRSTWSSSDRRR